MVQQPQKRSNYVSFLCTLVLWMTIVLSGPGNAFTTQLQRTNLPTSTSPFGNYRFFPRHHDECCQPHPNNRPLLRKPRSKLYVATVPQYSDKESTARVPTPRKRKRRLHGFLHFLRSTSGAVAQKVASKLSSPSSSLARSKNNNGENDDKEDQPKEKTKKTNQQPQQEQRKYNITTLEDLESYWADKERRFRKNNDNGDINYADLLGSLNVSGDTQLAGSLEDLEYIHPVAQLIHHRKQTQSKMVPDGERRQDGARLALAIEGGGMRGCVSAGMICCLGYLNLTDVFDVVYGSSAGTIVGAYLTTGQLQWFGPEVYYDQLTTAGRAFIDTRRILRALGFGLLDPRLLKDVVFRPSSGKPVLNLPFLLKRTVQQTKPLDWETFVEMQRVQPLKVVASGLKSEKAVVMDMKNGHFETLEEMTDCMHASCLLPGIAGPVANLDTSAIGPRSNSSANANGPKREQKKLILKNNIKGDQYEPLADALVCEPLPYRSAVAEGATHVLVIRSRPDGKDVTGKANFFENLIYRRFFLRKNRLPRIYDFFRKQLHKKLYAEDIITLNKASTSRRNTFDTSGEAHLMTIAAPPGSPEVTRLETDRAAIFKGFRRGFARAYDCLVEDPAERGRGAEVAKEFFPDEILDYNPLEISDTKESAFDVYMRQQGVTPKAWDKKVESKTTMNSSS